MMREITIFQITIRSDFFSTPKKIVQHTYRTVLAGTHISDLNCLFLSVSASCLSPSLSLDQTRKTMICAVVYSMLPPFDDNDKTKVIMLIVV